MKRGSSARNSKQILATVDVDPHLLTGMSTSSTMDASNAGVKESTLSIRMGDDDGFNEPGNNSDEQVLSAKT